MTKAESLLITGKNLRAESLSDNKYPYHMDRHEASIHLWALDGLEPQTELEEQEIKAERRRMKEYYKMRWP